MVPMPVMAAPVTRPLALLVAMIVVERLALVTLARATRSLAVCPAVKACIINPQRVNIGCEN
jgi:hypothetical protein